MTRVELDALDVARRSDRRRVPPRDRVASTATTATSSITWRPDGGSRGATSIIRRSRRSSTESATRCSARRCWACASFPRCLHGALVVLTALLARELGGDARAQIAAAIAAAVAPMLLTIGHFLATVTPEVLAVVCHHAVRRPHRSTAATLGCGCAVGALAGLGLLDKWTTGFLVVGLAVGLLLVPERTVLRTPWLLAGIAVALVIWAAESAVAGAARVAAVRGR